MKLRKVAAPATISVLILAASCSTPKNITYFQDITNGAVIESSQQMDVKVRPEDKLSIIVNTQDPALSMMFNLVQTQNRIGQTTSSTNSSSSANSNGQTAYYTVSPEGTINFPVLGKLHIAGMTRWEVAQFIEKQLISKKLVKDPIVTVEFVNTGISIIGEVSSPGRYEFNKDRLSLIDAIAMAGDLTPNGQRENVIVMREDSNGKQRAYRVDLTDLNGVVNSPVYYLQQNDVIYVEPNDKKKRDTTSSGNSAYNPSFWVSIASMGVSVATLITTLTK